MYKYTRNYYGPVRACVLDWSGTVIDKYSIAPVSALMKTFADLGIKTTADEIRGSMGIRKDKHIEDVLKIPNIEKQWIKNNNSKPDKEDIKIIMELYKEQQLNCIHDYTNIIPHVKRTLSSLRNRKKIKLAGTTGFTKDITKQIMKDTIKQGLAFDAFVSGDDVANGSRPNPFMLYRCMEILNIPEIKSIVKIDDTVSGIHEGLNAGCWTVGIAQYSNYMNINDPKTTILHDLNYQIKLNGCKDKFIEAGAHYTINNITELPKIISDINNKLNLGIKP